MKTLFLFTLSIFITFTVVFPQNKILESGLYEVIDSGNCSKTDEYLSLSYLSEQLCIYNNPLISVSEFDSVKVTSANLYDENIFALTIQLNEYATKIFEQITSRYIAKRLALIINDEIIIAPYVKGVIHSGKFSIEDDELKIKELEKLIVEERKKL